MDSGRLESVPPGTAHLDTVRTLHQTVVSLRTALEVSKNELKELKEKYEQHSNCYDYADVIEKLTVENHILRRKIIDSGLVDKDSQNIKLQVTYSPEINVEEGNDSEVLKKTDTTNNSVIAKDQSEEEIDYERVFLKENLENIQEENSKSVINSKTETPISQSEVFQTDPKSQVTATEEIKSHLASYKTKLELLSKFDVKIRVKTVKEGSLQSSTTSDTESNIEQKKDRTFHKKATIDSLADFHFEEKKEHFDNFKDSEGNQINLKTVSSDNVKMAVPNEAEVKSKSDKFDVQVRITSEDNLIVKNTECLRGKDALNLDVDDLSLRSLSEGENSVFSEGDNSPLEGGGGPTETDNASGNESEVDDIELIFTTDESRDMSNLQEDLVSIREADQWAPSSASTVNSTPVLIKFHTLDPDFQPGEGVAGHGSSRRLRAGNSGLKQKRVSLPNDREMRHVAFKGKSLDLPGRGILRSCDNRSDNALYRKSPNASAGCLDSVDSLPSMYDRGLSFDRTKSSSFELDSSMDVLHRGESVDSVHRPGRPGHRYSVFVETDISKCGISEDDLTSNFANRRNTCPNAFQYRPLPYRGAERAGRATGVGGAGLVSSRRPVLREGGAPTRESAAQTDMSALPPRWTSDGYLAHKGSSLNVHYLTTVPCRPSPCRRLAVPEARPQTALRSGEARRVLLSDIGFTSMVPELSRSAEPLWNLRRAAPDSPAPRCISPSMFRSPCHSIERSNEWRPQDNYNQRTKVAIGNRPWRGSLPDVRHEDTERLLEEVDIFLRRSIDNLAPNSTETDRGCPGQPYVPAEARQLRLGHAVKLITPRGCIAVGRVRYVGIAGGSAANSGVVVGAEFPLAEYPAMARNDGTYRGRRYFLATANHTALFVPFSKVVMAWAN